MFRAHVLIIRRSKLHYTASGIITPMEVKIALHSLWYHHTYGGQNFITQPLVPSHLWRSKLHYTASGIITRMEVKIALHSLWYHHTYSVMIPEAV